MRSQVLDVWPVVETRQEGWRGDAAKGRTNENRPIVLNDAQRSVVQKDAIIFVTGLQGSPHPL